VALTVSDLPPELRLPLVERLDPARADHAAILAAHERALALDEDGYLDPTTGYLVFTAQALWDRGRCCNSGCRHCPYDDGPRAGWPVQPERGIE
jgi:hypothetical protein